MSQLIARMRDRLLGLWRASRPLTAVALLMLPVLAGCLLGLWLDPRSVLGAPVWLKPAKFALSIAIYCLTLAWAFRHLPAYPRTRHIVGRLSALVFAIEMLIISVQAARGTISHFNVGTPLDGALFTIMGLGIVTQTLASVAVAVALWRQTFADRALGWALRLGLTITIVGASVGGIMSRPTAQQLRNMQAGRPSVAGAHTVGAPDGGPGLRLTGWSREHGDLRVSHFMGLHALQALPLLALSARRRRWSEPRRVRLILLASASYVSLLGILLWQALRGQPLLAPDATTASALLVWLLSTLILWPLLTLRRELRGAPVVAAG
jgi:hypothetical protein